MFYSVIVLCAVLGVGAHDVPCDVTHGPGWTSYRVPDTSGTGCEFSWSNHSRVVVANHLVGSKPLVLNHSVNLLTTQTCLEQVYYRRLCISEEVSHNATCTAACLRPAQRVNDPESRSHWGFVAAVVAFAAVTVLLVIIVIISRACFSGRRRFDREDIEDKL